MVVGCDTKLSKDSSDSLQIWIVSPLGATKSSLQCSLRHTAQLRQSDLLGSWRFVNSLCGFARSRAYQPERSRMSRYRKMSTTFGAQSEGLRKSDETVTSGR